MDFESLDRLDDRDLLERFLAGKDEGAFEALVRRHGPLVARVCARMLEGSDADDAFQATFLVLAQHAAVLRKRGSVGPWLYGVAVRVARKARSSEAARRRREREAGGGLMAQQRDFETHAQEQALWREARPLLDEELDALPEKYRAPLVLCYLEGQSNEQAAAALGWTKGTLSGRLARARDLLRERLARRGTVLSLALLVGLLESEAHAAVVAPALAGGTAKAAALVAAGQVPAAGALSVQANLLYEGVTQMLYWAKVKAAAALVATALVVSSGTGIVVWQVQAAEPQAPQLPQPQGVAEGPAPVPVAGGDAAPGAPDAPSAVFTLADHGKTVQVPVDTSFAVRLTDDTAGAGWEGGLVTPADEGTLIVSGQSVLKDGAYNFPYRAKAQGTVALRMVYVSPGGPGVVDRRKTKLLKEFKLTVEVASPPRYAFTRADHGKTVQVKVGESFEVRLAGDHAKTGWEARYSHPESSLSQAKLVFQAKAGATDAAIGTYVFTYQALKAGRTVVDVAYVSPGGPVPMARTATALVGEFKLTVDVVADTPVFEKGGLQVFVKPAKPVFAPKEKLAFTFTYKNSSDKPLLLYDHAFVYSWAMKFTREGEEGWWSKVAVHEIKRAVPPTLQLDSGKTLVVAVDLSQYEYLRGGVQLRRNAPVPDLGPGKYRVVLEFELKEDPIREKQFQAGAVWWKGKIETKAVAFEIAAEAKEAATAITEARAREIALAEADKHFAWRTHHKGGNDVIRSIKLEKGVWRLHFSADDGLKALGAHIEIDAESGKVIAFKHVPGA